MTSKKSGMLKIHADALDSKLASYHEFLGRYSKTKSVVYGFVEGKTDPVFYRGFIEHMLPEGWEVELWPAGNKNAVYRIHSDIDWRRFRKNRVCFFVDRDFSDLIPEKRTSDKNIYVTDGYSIENDIVRRGTCQRMLTEIFGLSTVEHDEIDCVCDMFEEEFEKFVKALIPVMAWILHWRTIRAAASLGNIKMNHMFKISKGCVVKVASPKGKSDVVEYIHDQCDVKLDITACVDECKKEFQRESIYQKFTRGKYLMWFLVEFCRSVHEHANEFFSSVSRPPKMHVTISAANAVQIVGNRARVPKSLREFLSNTYTLYIESRK